MKNKNQSYGALHSVYGSCGCNNCGSCNTGNNCNTCNACGSYSANNGCSYSGRDVYYEGPCGKKCCGCGNNGCCHENACSDNCARGGCARHERYEIAEFYAHGSGCGAMELRMHGESGWCGACTGGARISRCGRYAAFYVFEGACGSSGARYMAINGNELHASRSWGGADCGQAIFTASAGDVISLDQGAYGNGGEARARLIIIRID